MLNDQIERVRRKHRARVNEQEAAFAALCAAGGRNTRSARTGLKLMRLAVFIEVVTPLLAIAAMMAFSALPVLAQTPGGPIFGANDQTAGRGIVEFIKYFRNVIFLAGIFFFGWAGLNMGFEKPWGGKAMAGLACWGFAALSAVAYSFSQGSAVQLDTDLGN